MLLGSDYKALQGQLFRTDADSQQYFPWMILAHVLLSGAFVWIYAKGVESRDWFPQGLRYGVAIALLTIVPTYIIYFVVTFFLSRRATWSLPFTLLVLVAGLIPLLIFWVEHRVMQKLTAENPELVGVAHSQA